MKRISGKTVPIAVVQEHQETIQIGDDLIKYLVENPVFGPSDYTDLPGVKDNVQSSWREFSRYGRHSARGSRQQVSAEVADERRRRAEKARKQQEMKIEGLQRKREEQAFRRALKRKLQNQILDDDYVPDSEKCGEVKDSSLRGVPNVIISSPVRKKWGRRSSSPKVSKVKRKLENLFSPARNDQDSSHTKEEENENGLSKRDPQSSEVTSVEDSVKDSVKTDQDKDNPQLEATAKKKKRIKTKLFKVSSCEKDMSSSESNLWSLKPDSVSTEKSPGKTPPSKRTRKKERVNYSEIEEPEEDDEDRYSYVQVTNTKSGRKVTPASRKLEEAIVSASMQKSRKREAALNDKDEECSDTDSMQTTLNNSSSAKQSLDSLTNDKGDSGDRNVFDLGNQISKDSVSSEKEKSSTNSNPISSENTTMGPTDPCPSAIKVQFEQQQSLITNSFLHPVSSSSHPVTPSNPSPDQLQGANFLGVAVSHNIISSLLFPECTASQSQASFSPHPLVPVSSSAKTLQQNLPSSSSSPFQGMNDYTPNCNSSLVFNPFTKLYQPFEKSVSDTAKDPKSKHTVPALFPTPMPLPTAAHLPKSAPHPKPAHLPSTAHLPSPAHLPKPAHLSSSTCCPPPAHQLTPYLITTPTLNINFSDPIPSSFQIPFHQSDQRTPSQEKKSSSNNKRENTISVATKAAPQSKVVVSLNPRKNSEVEITSKSSYLSSPVPHEGNGGRQTGETSTVARQAGPMNSFPQQVAMSNTSHIDSAAMSSPIHPSSINPRLYWDGSFQSPSACFASHSNPYQLHQLKAAPVQPHNNPNFKNPVAVVEPMPNFPVVSTHSQSAGAVPPNLTHTVQAYEQQKEDPKSQKTWQAYAHQGPNSLSSASAQSAPVYDKHQGPKPASSTPRRTVQAYGNKASQLQSSTMYNNNIDIDKSSQISASTNTPKSSLDSHKERIVQNASSTTMVSGQGSTIQSVMQGTASLLAHPSASTLPAAPNAHGHLPQSFPPSQQPPQISHSKTPHKQQLLTHATTSERTPQQSSQTNYGHASPAQKSLAKTKQQESNKNQAGESKRRRPPPNFAQFNLKPGPIMLPSAATSLSSQSSEFSPRPTSCSSLPTNPTSAHKDNRPAQGRDRVCEKEVLSLTLERSQHPLARISSDPTSHGPANKLPSSSFASQHHNPHSRDISSNHSGKERNSENNATEHQKDHNTMVGDSIREQKYLATERNANPVSRLLAQTQSFVSTIQHLPTQTVSTSSSVMVVSSSSSNTAVTSTSTAQSISTHIMSAQDKPQSSSILNIKGERQESPASLNRPTSLIDRIRIKTEQISAEHATDSSSQIPTTSSQTVSNTNTHSMPGENVRGCEKEASLDLKNAGSKTHPSALSTCEDIKTVRKIRPDLSSHVLPVKDSPLNVTPLTSSTTTTTTAISSSLPSSSSSLSSSSSSSSPSSSTISLTQNVIISISSPPVMTTKTVPVDSHTGQTPVKKNLVIEFDDSTFQQHAGQKSPVGIKSHILSFLAKKSSELKASGLQSNQSSASVISSVVDGKNSNQDTVKAKSEGYQKSACDNLLSNSILNDDSRDKMVRVKIEAVERNNPLTFGASSPCSLEKRKLPSESVKTSVTTSTANSAILSSASSSTSFTSSANTPLSSSVPVSSTAVSVSVSSSTSSSSSSSSSSLLSVAAASSSLSVVSSAAVATTLWSPASNLFVSSSSVSPTPISVSLPPPLHLGHPPVLSSSMVALPSQSGSYSQLDTNTKSGTPSSSSSSSLPEKTCRSEYTTPAASCKQDVNLTFGQSRSLVQLIAIKKELSSSYSNHGEEEEEEEEAADEEDWGEESDSTRSNPTQPSASVNVLMKPSPVLNNNPQQQFAATTHPIPEAEAKTASFVPRQLPFSVSVRSPKANSNSSNMQETDGKKGVLMSSCSVSGSPKANSDSSNMQETDRMLMSSNSGIDKNKDVEHSGVKLKNDIQSSSRGSENGKQNCDEKTTSWSTRDKESTGWSAAMLESGQMGYGKPLLPSSTGAIVDGNRKNSDEMKDNQTRSFDTTSVSRSKEALDMVRDKCGKPQDAVTKSISCGSGQEKAVSPNNLVKESPKLVGGKLNSSAAIVDPKTGKSGSGGLSNPSGSSQVVVNVDDDDCIEIIDDSESNVVESGQKGKNGKEDCSSQPVGSADDDVLEILSSDSDVEEDSRSQSVQGSNSSRTDSGGKLLSADCLQHMFSHGHEDDGLSSRSSHSPLSSPSGSGVISRCLQTVGFWKKDQVADWLKKNKLQKICLNLSNLDGPGLQRMAFEYYRNPEAFYNRVKKSLGLTMFQTLVIGRSLKALIHSLATE